jgi:XTP/dITP diphosphohydrolase
VANAATRRLAGGARLVVASHNPGKLREITDLVRPYGLATASARDLAIPEPEETEVTFAGNARLKALHAARTAGLPALADDSGLCVDALDGAPGVYSARWAGPAKDFTLAMARVHDEVSLRCAWTTSGPRAHFVSALCLAWPDGHAQVYEGRVFGRLVWPGRGSHGFGYDPIFLADGEDETYGELDQARKHATSHRAVAFAKFVKACLDPAP